MTPDSFRSSITSWALSVSQEKRIKTWKYWRAIVLAECSSVEHASYSDDYLDNRNSYAGSARLISEWYPDKLEKIYAKFVLVAS